MIADAHVDTLLELAHREHRLGETDVFARTWLPLLEAGGVRAPDLPRLRRPGAPAGGSSRRCRARALFRFLGESLPA